MLHKILLVFLLIFLLIPIRTEARIEMVTLPDVGSTQLTIYNSADITLVRDERVLTFKKGINRIEFSWANTLIDPTSVVFLPLAQKSKIEILDTTFPPRIANTLIWNIQSEFSGKVPVVISYFTSGISWAADYNLQMDPTEKAATLRAFVTVNNNSGEDYKNSQVRLVVGKINLVERIAQLATSPQADEYEEEDYDSAAEDNEAILNFFSAKARSPRQSAPKKIIKEGLSEYFIYTVEGRETIENTWGKRLPSFKIDDVPVKSLFKLEEHRLGNQPLRFVTFLNNKEHKMGKEPLPDGLLRIFKNDAKSNLQYLGQASQKYIPVDATVEVNLGVDPEVKTEVTQMNYKTDGFTFNQRGEISGWDTWRTWQIRVRNFKSNPITIQIRRRHNGKFQIKTRQEFRMEDYQTVEFTREIPAGTDFDVLYTVQEFHGANAQGK